MLIKKIRNTSGLATITVLNIKISEVENKIPNTSNLVPTNALNTKVSKVDNKILDNSKHINNQEFNKLTTEKFAARLKQADLSQNIFVYQPTFDALKLKKDKVTYYF